MTEYRVVWRQDFIARSFEEAALKALAALHFGDSIRVEIIPKAEMEAYLDGRRTDDGHIEMLLTSNGVEA